MREDKAPELWVLGGPNGSGKSTLIDKVTRYPKFPAVYINADEL